MGEVDIRIQCCCHAFMLRKLFAVIECDGVAFILVGTQQARCHGCDTSGMLAAYMPRQHITRHPFSQRDQPAFVVLADDGIALPITHVCFLSNDVRTFINADTVADGATPFLSTCITLATRLLASQTIVDPEFETVD